MTAAAMGAHLARRYAGGADTEPDPLAMPTFPADLGLPGREPRSKGGPGALGGGGVVRVGPVWGPGGLCRPRN